MTRGPVSRSARVASAVALVYVVLLVTYVTVVLGGPFAAHRAGDAVVGTDSIQILDAARHAFWTPQAGLIPPLYILLVQVCGRRVAAIGFAQTVVYGAAWLWLAYEVRGALRHRVVRIVAPITVLALSLAPELVLWTTAVGTEALSLALLAATIAALLALVTRRRRRDTVLFVVFIVLGTFARDTNAVLAVVVAAVAVVIAVRYRSARMAGLGVAAICVAAVVGANALSGQAEPPRWFYPLQDTIVLRLMPDPDARAYLIDHGMPMASAVTQVAGGENYFLYSRRLDEDRGFAPFRRWLRDDGPSTYASYLASHPVEVVRGPWNSRTYILAPRFAGYLFGTHEHARPGALYGILGALVFWRVVPIVVLWCVLALAGAWWCVRRRRDDRMVVAALAAVVVTGVGHAMLAYLGDVLEVGRHSLSANAQIRIGLWVLTAIITDRLLGDTQAVSDAVQ